MKRYQSFKVKSKIAGKKGAKSGDMNATLKLLVDSFGGERALARKSPICAGRYNSTKANDVISFCLLYSSLMQFHPGCKTSAEHFQV